MKKNEKLAIIDYGVGNLFSVHKAFSQIGVKSFISSDPTDILESGRVVLPGVGAFGNAMRKLAESGLVPVVHEVAKTGKPLLGICVGAQLLLESSREFGLTSGLGIIKGEVLEIPKESETEVNIRVPHIGWNNLIYSSGLASTKGTVLDSIPEKSMFYFVHSYMLSPTGMANRLADFNYHGLTMPAVIQEKNVIGAQFHPEKSGDVGLKLLRNFCEL